jgi:rare lipoprotein A
MLEWRNRCRDYGELFATLVLCLLVASCSRDPVRDETNVPVKPNPPAAQSSQREPPSRYGNPDSYVVFGKTYRTLKSSNGFRERGVASWYGEKFHGRKTSSGEIYDMYYLTAAHKHLPLPTSVRVTNLENNRSIVVRVNDRGPFHDNRVLDVSFAAAQKLGMVEKGTAFVSIEALGSGSNDVELVSGNVTSANDELLLYIQIGAFAKKPNAQKLFEQVSKKLSNFVRIRAVSVNNQSLYRVQVGPIATVDFADQIVATLSGIGISEHHFITH